MKYNKELKGKIGIYKIICLPTNKVYIGKSKNLYNRFKHHTTSLNRKLSKHENQYLINAWKKYGENNFKFEVIEYCKYDNLAERELYWILKYDSINPLKGFNLRLDTELGMIPSDESRLKMSIAQKKRNLNMSPEEKKINRLRSVNMWKNFSNEEIEQLKDNLSKSRTRYKWFQYDKEMNLIKEWTSVRDILKENPNYKRHNIYAVASGEKPSIYGYIWKKLMI